VGCFYLLNFNMYSQYYSEFLLILIHWDFIYIVWDLSGSADRIFLILENLWDLFVSGKYSWRIQSRWGLGVTPKYTPDRLFVFDWGVWILLWRFDVLINFSRNEDDYARFDKIKWHGRIQGGGLVVKKNPFLGNFFQFARVF